MEHANRLIIQLRWKCGIGKDMLFILFKKCKLPWVRCKSLKSVVQAMSTRLHWADNSYM